MMTERRANGRASFSRDFNGASEVKIYYGFVDAWILRRGALKKVVISDANKRAKGDGV